MIDIIVRHSGKILAFFVNILIIAVGVLGIKIQNDKNDLVQLKESMDVNQTVNDLVSLQKQIADNRENNLSKIANAPKQVITQQETISTVTPGKVVPQTTTVTSGGTTSKKSSTTKTTKSS